MTEPIRAYTLSAFQARRADGNVPAAYEQPDHTYLSNLPADMNPVTVEHRRQHVLPGAKRAITHQQLQAWQTEGLTELQMLERVNGDWDRANTERMERFEEWRQGPLVEAVERAKRRQIAYAIERAERVAEIERELP